MTGFSVCCYCYILIARSCLPYICLQHIDHMRQFKERQFGFKSWGAYCIDIVRMSSHSWIGCHTICTFCSRSSDSNTTSFRAIFKGTEDILASSETDWTYVAIFCNMSFNVPLVTSPDHALDGRSCCACWWEQIIRDCSACWLALGRGSPYFPAKKSRTH